MAQEANQATNKRTLWRTGVVGHPDYRLPTSPKPASDTEKKTLFPVKIRCSRNFTLRKKTPNSHLPSSPGIQLQSFSKLQLSSDGGSPVKSRGIFPPAYHSSQVSLNLTSSDTGKYGAGSRDEKKRHPIGRPRSCAADIDVSVTSKRREFAESSSRKERAFDNDPETGLKDSDDDERNREKEASLDLIRASLSAAFDPNQRQMLDDQVFEDDQIVSEIENQNPVEISYPTSFENDATDPDSANPAQISSDVTGAEAAGVTSAESESNKPLVRPRTGRGIHGAKALSAIYDSLPSSPLFNPGETWRYRDASTQCREEDAVEAASPVVVEKKTELRRRKYGRAFRQKRAATIGGNAEQSTGERKRKTLPFFRSQSECGSTGVGEQVTQSCSFRHFREKKRNYLHFPDYLIASMTLLPDYINFMEDNRR